MSRLFLSLLFLSVTLSGALAADTLRVACVGNSITYGMGINDRSKTYPAVLKQLIGPEAMVGNFGVSARTLLRKGDRPYWKEKALSDALAFAPDIVVIKLGTNDTKPFNWVYHEDFEKDLSALADTFLNLGSQPEVYLCLPIPADHPGWGIRDSITRNEIIPIIRRVAEKKNLPIIDLYTPLTGRQEYYQPDHVHPNFEGAAEIARIVKQHIIR